MVLLPLFTLSIGAVIWLFLERRRFKVQLCQEQEKSKQLDLKYLDVTQDNMFMREELAKFQALSEADKKHYEESQRLLKESEERLSSVFKALSGDVLKSQSESFLQLAKRTLEQYQDQAKGELNQKEKSIRELLNPVKESLEKFDKKVEDLEKSRHGAYEGLKEQVRSLINLQDHLRKETQDLVKALRSPVARGRWGEIQLKRVVELAGMLEYCDFNQQTTTTTDANERLRPDLVVRLPGGRQIVIDAKAPLQAYLEAYQCQNENDRVAHLKDHARHVRTHIMQLSKKSYWEQFHPSPEFVVLFLPGEIFFSSALEQDPSLIEQGVEQGVILATPTTLIALLRAIAYGWNQERVSQNAEAVCKLGQELYKRLLDMSGHWSKMGRSLNQTLQSYNRAVGSLENRVLSSARKFQEMGISTKKEELPELEGIETLPRELSQLSRD